MTIGSSSADIGRRRARWAITISILVHLVAALFYVRGDPLRSVLHPRVRPTPREIVTIVERLSVERKRARLPAPQRHRRSQHRPVPLAPRKIALQARLPITQPVVLPRPIPPKPVRARPKELVKLVPQRALAEEPHDAPVAAPRRLSGAQIAQIETGLRSVIAREGEGHDPLAVPPAAVDAPKRYGLDAASFTQGDREHHGLCDPVKDWTGDGFDYYYVACNVRFSDGTFERQSVPWPVRFPPNDDPFAGTARGEKPLAMPLPGWHLSEGETVTVELRAYAKEHGIDL